MGQDLINRADRRRINLQCKHEDEKNKGNRYEIWYRIALKYLTENTWKQYYDRGVIV